MHCWFSNVSVFNRSPQAQLACSFLRRLSLPDRKRFLKSGYVNVFSRRERQVSASSPHRHPEPRTQPQL